MQEQPDFFVTESYEYFRRNYGGADLRSLPMVHFLEDLLVATSINVNGGAILDLGCGAANNLNHLVRRLGAGRGVGTEPSPDTISILAQAYPDLEFVETLAHRLPFDSGEFELVLLRSVLLWVHPDYLLQSIGEALRVSSRYLIINDFTPEGESYSAKYRDHPRFRTYKRSYVPILEASGFVETKRVLVHDADSGWTRTETVLYEKVPLDDAFPLHTSDDFE